jgi:hypothetical protein
MKKRVTKQLTQKMSIYFPPELLESVRKQAQEDKRSFNAEVLWILQQFLEKQKSYEDSTRLQN